MKIWFRITALLLPLIALAASWAFTHFKAQQGTIWIVPINGYDPRDLLRGHYITYRYDWPELEFADNQTYISALCIRGTAPTVETALILTGYDFIRDGASEKGCAIVARNAPGSESPNGLSSGKIYIAQTKAAGLERKLFDPKLQAFVHIKIRDDGIVTPIKLDFRPRPAPLPQ